MTIKYAVIRPCQVQEDEGRNFLIKDFPTEIAAKLYKDMLKLTDSYFFYEIWKMEKIT